MVSAVLFGAASAFAGIGHAVIVVATRPVRNMTSLANAIIMDYVMLSGLHHCYVDHLAITRELCRVAVVRADNFIALIPAVVLQQAHNAYLPAVPRKCTVSDSAGVLKKVNANLYHVLQLIVGKDRFVGKDSVCIINSTQEITSTSQFFESFLLSINLTKSFLYLAGDQNHFLQWMESICRSLVIAPVSGCFWKDSTFLKSGKL